jgi:hypothetical protein
MMPVKWAKPPHEVKTQDEVHILDYEQGGDILGAEEEYVTVQVVMDSGAIKHVTPPDCLPQGVEVHRSAGMRNFQAANGGSIKNYGTASVTIEGDNQRQANCVYNVADVTRTLHAAGPICDEGFEVLHTKHGAVTVPEGHLSQFLVPDQVVAKYPRKAGGLYVADFKVRAPRNRAADTPETGFTRPGMDH